MKQERLNQFFQEMAGDVGQLKENAIDREFLASDEFSDLIEEICLRTARTKSARKRSHLRRVLVSAIGGKRDQDFGQLFMNVLDEITEVELRVFEGFTKYADAMDRGEKFEMGSVSYDSDIWGIDGKVAKQMVQSLIRKGLLFDDSRGKLSTQAYEIIKPTELGGRFLRWLSE